MASYYIVRFNTVCEECGQPFEGVFYRMVPTEDGSPLTGVLTDGMLATAEYLDARMTKSSLESRLKERRWSELSSGGVMAGVSYAEPFHHSCPHCGARQSWDPMDEPKEPEKTETVGGRIAYIIFSAFFLGIIGMLVGLFAMVIIDDAIGLLVCAALGVAAGIALGVWIGNNANKEAIETYDQRLEAYEREKAAYDAYQASLATRTTRNEPVPDFDSGCFAQEIPATN